MTGILSGKYSDLFPAIPLSFFLWWKIENGLKTGVEGYGGIERITAVAFKTFDNSGFTFAEKVGKLRIGQVFFCDGSENRQTAIGVLTFGDLRIEYDGIPIL